MLTPEKHSPSITGVHIFPIKSCHEATVDGLLPTTLNVGKTGLEALGVADREFVLAEEVNGRAELHFVTQRGWTPNKRFNKSNRGDTALATVRPNITADSLELTGPVGFGSVVIPTDYDEQPRQKTVDIFSKPLRNAIDQGDSASDFFSTILGRTVRLMRANRSVHRLLQPEYRIAGASNSVAAADSFPMLLTSQKSLNASHLQAGFPPGTVPLGQFRGNIEIDGAGFEPYDEDFWTEISIGSLRAFVAKACQRCPIPNVNQDTGERNIRAQQVLRGRLGFISEPGDKQVVFGQNLNHVYKDGLNCSVGDTVQVLQRSNVRNFTLV